MGGGELGNELAGLLKPLGAGILSAQRDRPFALSGIGEASRVAPGTELLRQEVSFGQNRGRRGIYCKAAAKPICQLFYSSFRLGVAGSPLADSLPMTIVTLTVILVSTLR